MTTNSGEAAGKKSLGCGATALLIFGAILVIAVSCTMMAGGGESASSACRQLASDRFAGGPGQYTEVTFTDGDSIKGRVVQIRDGQERPHHHWECSYESGEPVITFDSPAAG